MSYTAVLFMIGPIVLLAGLVISFIFARRQQNHELDKSMSQTTVKHRILANPGLLAYASIILFGMIIIGFFIIYHSK